MLFVGSLTQRKGLSYLLEAVDSLGARAELTLIGRPPNADCVPLRAALGRHNHIPSLPHREILRQMSRNDVLVLPSLYEGFGLVLLEAMAQGLPIVTTFHTAGPDLITEGQEGFLVPIRSSQAIAERLEILARDRDLLRVMSEAALRRARELTWRSYGERMISLLRLHTGI